MDQENLNVASSPDISVVAASNDRSILDSNLRRSPMISSGRVSLHVEWNAISASVAYNRGWDATSSEYVVFAHQDVYLPFGWDVRLRICIEQLNRHDPNWALIGSFGVDAHGIGFGPVWSTSLGSIVGRVATAPTVVQSFDELLMVARRSAALRFDESAPNFHFYGLDAVQAARAMNKKSYVMSLPVVHNDKFHGKLENDFSEAYIYMRRKWWSVLPLHTSVTTVSRHGYHLYKNQWQNRKSFKARKSASGRTDVDPQFYATLCGWDNLAPSTQAFSYPRSEFGVC